MACPGSEKNTYPSESPLEINYDFTIGDYILTNENEKYINMNLETSNIGKKIEKDREIPVQNKFSIAFNNENTLEVPEGWTIDFIPENILIENELLSYESNYEVKDNKVILYQQTSISFLNMSKEHFELWNESIKKIKKNQNEVVILKQKNE